MITLEMAMDMQKFLTLSACVPCIVQGKQRSIRISWVREYKVCDYIIRPLATKVQTE